MSYVIKVTHDDTLRRLTLEKQPGAPGGLTFAQLEAQVDELFELPASTKVKLTYVDSDDNVVTMMKNVDLKDAFFDQRLNPLRLKAVLVQKEPMPKPAQKQANRPDPAAAGNANRTASPVGADVNQPVHPGVTCHRCRTAPIIGCRYHSKMVPFYDLCSNCLVTVGNCYGEFVLIDPPLDPATQTTLKRMQQQQGLANLQSKIYYNEADNSIAV
ncbi:hypothetical protein R1flu_025891 [Riccia fluitans]|uniref:ZZ-type domain-containing protein n=1 Tax=Riccia fluitans TaxID=41844 RepID=A0ABD1XZ31_9MARC